MMSWKDISYHNIGITKFFNVDEEDENNDLELLGKQEYYLDLFSNSYFSDEKLSYLFWKIFHLGHFLFLPNRFLLKDF